MVEFDAVGLVDAGDIRYRLVQACLRDVAKRGATRFHVACADAAGNVEFFMQAGFARYGDEMICFGPSEQPLPEPLSEAEAGSLGSGPSARPTPLPCSASTARSRRPRSSAWR